MADGAWSLAAIAGSVLAYIALETWRPGLVPPAIAFTAAGLVLGAEGVGWIDVSPDAGALRLLAEATLAFVLFSDASRMDLRALRDGYGVPARLLGIGLPHGQARPCASGSRRSPAPRMPSPSRTPVRRRT